MKEKSFETNIQGVNEVHEGKINNIESNYGSYQELGGIINENDYESIVDRANSGTETKNVQRWQVESMAKIAGIELEDLKDTIDPVVVLYGILRSDRKPVGIEHHHSQMSDQRLFAEALRILGDNDSLKKLIEAHPNIAF